MNTKLKLLSALICAAVLAGCASIPDSNERASLSDLSSNAISGWETTPALTYRTHRQAAQLMAPERIPEELYQKTISLELSTRVNIEELAQIIQMSGIPTILATDELSSSSAYIPSYHGPVGALLDSLSTASDLSFTWASGVLVIDKDSAYLLRIPQNNEIGEMISSALGTMGAEDVEASKEAGLVSFRASNRDRARIEAYLDRLAVNTSMVNLQMAVMNVTLDEERRRGLDWSSLTLEAGELGLLGEAAQEGVSAAASGIEASVTGVAGQVSGSNLGLIFKSDNLNLQGVLNMLSTYGESRTVQNLTLKTLSGIPVELRSGETIPYVEEITLNVNERSTSSGTNTASVDTGFDVEVIPMYDAEDQLVTIELDLSMKNLVGWEELSTGGSDRAIKIRQPRIQEQSLTNIARLEAGETALIGGLVYESVTDNRTSLAGMERLPVGSKAISNKHNALFILLRPTVVVYGPRPVDGELSQ